MPIETINGSAASHLMMGDSGLLEVTGPLSAADLLANFEDTQAPALYGFLPGVLSGGVCTAATLTVTVPTGTLVYCRSVWFFNSAATKVVSDAATSYVWLCSDGELRTSASATVAPVGYTMQTACLLTKAVAS